MIVWIASYPRSGNTFLRAVLHALYSVPTYSIYDDDDPVAQRVGPELVGYRRKPNDRALMADSSEVYLVKTHKRRKIDGYRAIYLVRDGRDAVVSHARLRASMGNGSGAPPFVTLLREEITRPYIDGQPSSGTWGGNVLSWLDMMEVPVAVLKYEHLIADPVEAVKCTVSSLTLDLVPNADAVVPFFADLHSVDPEFFRRGVAGSYRDEMPDKLHDLFWAQPENVAAMRALGYLNAPHRITSGSSQ
jgi:Sulfotransferase domain